MVVAKENAVVLRHEDCTPTQFIEKVGRVCYKSEEKIGDGTDVSFVKMLLDRSHLAMLEHEYAYFRVKKDVFMSSILPHLNHTQSSDGTYIRDRYFNWVGVDMNLVYCSASFRALIEIFAGKEDVKKFLSGEVEDAGILSSFGELQHKLHDLYPVIFPDCEPFMGGNDTFEVLTREEFISKAQQHYFKICEEILTNCLPHTVLFTCDRGVSHELVRHRPASFAQESTRYCNYAGDRFNSSITVVNPFTVEGMEDTNSDITQVWSDAMLSAEEYYLELIDRGVPAQIARGVLPHNTKVDIVVTAVEGEWKHILDLRYYQTTGKAHPQMVQVMGIAYEQLKEEFKGITVE